MDELIKILVERDNIDISDALSIIIAARNEIKDRIADGNMQNLEEEICRDFFNLSKEYFFNII